MLNPKEPWSKLYVDPRVYTADLALPDPRSLRIYDTTLRDGEQMPGVALTSEQKYRICRELSDIGVHVIDLCFPTVSPEESRLLQLTLQGKEAGEIREDLEILVMCRASRADVDATIREIAKAGFPPNSVTFLIFSSASSLHVKYKLGRTLLRRAGRNSEDLDSVPLDFYHSANKEMVTEAISYARSRGVERIEFGGEDASRTDLHQLIDQVGAAVAAGAGRYVFADTTGSLTPEATRRYCQVLTATFPDIERVSHFHDDFGLATANTLVAIQHGFTTFTTTVNGIGERAGNASLHSVVVALRYLYGLEIPGFAYQRLGQLRNLLEQMTGIAVSPKEPVIGRNVYTHESGIHTHGVGIARIMYEPIPYQDVGGTPRFLYGKHSGSGRLEQLLKPLEADLGRPVDREFLSEILETIKTRRMEDVGQEETSAGIASYYDHLDRMGMSEVDVVALARELASVSLKYGAA